MGIAFSAIDRYARRYGIADIEAFEIFRALLKALDGLYVACRNNPNFPDLTAEITPDDSDYVRALLSPQADPEEDE